MQGCLSVLSAFAVVAASSVVGILVGAPMGVLGGIMGAVILPWALVLGVFGWGAVSVPWLLLRVFAPKLPEATTFRALLGFCTVSPLAAAWAGAYTARESDLGMLWQLGEAAGFGLAGLVFAAITAVFARNGMWVFVTVAAEGAGAAN